VLMNEDFSDKLEGLGRNLSVILGGKGGVGNPISQSIKKEPYRTWLVLDNNAIMGHLKRIMP
jgi:hypothetical protein